MNDELMKRPSHKDDFVKRRAAELALPEIKTWMGSVGRSDESLMRDLMRGLCTSDGYENAKSFEQLGWSVDAQLVDVLNNDYLYDARKELVKQWVACLGIKLAFPVGTKVLYRGTPGVIVKLEEETAEYGIHTDGLDPNQWRVCPSEDIKIAAEVAE